MEMGKKPQVKQQAVKFKVLIFIHVCTSFFNHGKLLKKSSEINYD